MRLHVTSLTDALVDSVRERIFAGEIVSGSALTEAALAAEYQVARPTARAAIERLVAEGILERAAHRSARVPVMSIDRVSDLYLTRNLLESQTYRQLAELRHIPEEADHAIAELGAATNGEDLDLIVSSDIAFHRALVAALHSDLLTKIHDALINEMRLCLAQVQSSRLLHPNEIVAEHAAIADAIRKGSADEAEAAGRYHLDHARSLLIEHLTREITP